MTISQDDLFVDYNKPAFEYWTEALMRIQARRSMLTDDSEASWEELARLLCLEEYARYCLESL